MHKVPRYDGQHIWYDTVTRVARSVTGCSCERDTPPPIGSCRRMRRDDSAASASDGELPPIGGKSLPAATARRIFAWAIGRSQLRSRRNARATYIILTFESVVTSLTGFLLTIVIESLAHNFKMVYTIIVHLQCKPVSLEDLRLPAEYPLILPRFRHVRIACRS